MTSDSAPVDGRLARSARTRTAVIDALLELYEQGDLSPTAVRVAAHAGVALRTVYGHFADLESLYAEAGQRELQRTLARSRPVDPNLPLSARLTGFVANRAAVLEWLLPVMRAAAVREADSPQLQRVREQFVALGDADVDQAFAAELAPMTPVERRGLHDAVHLVAGGPAWVTLRIDRGLTPEEARRLVQQCLEPVLGRLLGGVPT